MLSSNLNLSIRKTTGYNNKILINNIGMKISWDISIKKAEVYHQKSWLPAAQLEAQPAPEMYSMKSSDKSIKDAVTILPVSNQKMLAENHSGEKLVITLLIVGTVLIAYHFW